jgi:hypothetical protein
MIGLLTETIGSPTPMEIPFNLQRQLASADLPYPIGPQRWHFRQSVDYSVTANRAVIDVASRHREQFLFNAYRMGRNSIERGNRDHWTIRPDRIAAAQQALDKVRSIAGSGRSGSNSRVASDGGEVAQQGASESQTQTVAGRDSAQGDPGEAGAAITRSPENRTQRSSVNVYTEVLRDPAFRDPRGYVIPSNQPDFPTCTKFVNALIKNGIVVHHATSMFEAAGKTYPAGSYVIRTAQAFRPHILDMFEPQDHPDDFQYPGGPPIAPYDSAGWTLAFQMGIEFDRILEGFEGPFERIEGLAQPMAGTVHNMDNSAGFLFSRCVNDSFIAINRLLKDGEQVFCFKSSMALAGKSYPPGTFYIPQKPDTLSKLQRMARELGLDFEPLAATPAVDLVELHTPRVALWDSYGGSMSSGWVRWILEKFDFDFRLVFAPEMDGGDLASHYDVIIFTSGGIPAPPGASAGSDRQRGRESRLPSPESIPAEYHDRLGRVTTQKTIPQLKTFVENGGTIIAIGNSSASLARQFDIPVANALAEPKEGGTEQPLSSSKYYIPGSVLRMAIDNSNPVAYGMSDHTDVYFQNSPVMRLKPDAMLNGVKPIAWFDSDRPLRSGWAWGEHFLRDGISVAEATIGNGSVVLIGPEVTFRAQPHGTFKLLFNGIYRNSRNRMADVPPKVGQNSESAGSPRFSDD